MHQFVQKMGVLPLLFLSAMALPTPLPAAGKPGAAAKHHHHHEPVPGVQSLDVYAAGTRLHLLTGETSKDGTRTELLHRSSIDGGASWQDPVRLDAGQPPAFSASRGADPQIAAAGKRLFAVWMTAGTDAFGGGPMATALSEDGGKTWKPGPNPADDGSTTGHGFIDVAADKDGALHLTWLDTRDGKRGLRYARSEDGGKTWSKNETVDPETCECCWNVITTGADGRVGILYRDKGPRDMAIAWVPKSGEPWTSSKLGGFQWEFEGCPHVGGGLAAGAAGAVPVWHAVVWTGKEGSFGIHHLYSADAGASWSRTTQVLDQKASHPDVAAHGAQVITVCDVADGHGGSRISATLSSDGGRAWQSPLWLSDSGMTATHPRVIPVSDGFRVFWTQRKGDGPLTWEMKAVTTPSRSATAAATP